MRLTFEARRSFPETGRIATALLALAAVTSFGLSSLSLTALGVNYDGVGGSSFLKLHPATWLFVAALIANFVVQSRPLAYLDCLPRAFPGALLFALMTSITLIFASLIQHAASTPIVDTFLSGVAMLVLYEGVAEPTRRALRLTLHLIMLANACLGIGEFLTHHRLTPFVVAGVPILHDYRSTALLGHPLLNAGTTAGYVIALFLGGDGPKGPLLRAALMAVQSVGLVAFGGRTAIVLLAIIVALGSLPGLVAVLGGRRFDRGIAFAAACGLCLVAVALTFVASKGIFASFLERFANDKGSTQARVVIFELFNAFPLEELLFGPDPARLASLQRRLGIEYGIENSWLGLMFQYGAVITGFFVIGFMALLGDMAARSRRCVGVLILYFLILVSGAASISVKSFAFNQFAIIVLVLFDRSRTSVAAVVQASTRRKVFSSEPVRA